MARFSTLSAYFLFACIATSTVLAKPKTVIYWGQESDGKEQPLRHYCASGNYDIIVMGFAYEFPVSTSYVSDYPSLNFASHCETPFDSSMPQLLNCPEIGSDITYCQSLGVEIILSIGGGVGRYGFSSDDEAVKFGHLVWNMFMEGTHYYRPFGNAVINGVDLDIEGGSTVGYVAFINTLRTHFTTSSRTYVVSSAPQCVYPDGRLGPSGISTALGGGWMDYVFVQFYNNYCGLEFMPYLSVPQFNFDVWANWARTGSVNPNVKVFIGAPAATRAVGAGFVDATKLQAYAVAAMATYPDVYGGIMLWDTSNSDNNNNFGATVSAIVKAQAGSAPPVVVPSTTAAPRPSTTAAPRPSTTAAPRPSTSTTAAPRPSTSTTAAPRPSTSTTAAPRPLTTAAPRPSTSTSGVTAPSTPASTTCTGGHMKCLTSETYSMCDPNRGSGGAWSPAMSCQTGLTCKPNGNYIYCM